MTNFNELSADKRHRIVLLFSNWLKNYTHEVIVRVLNKRDEIINNEFAVELLEQMYQREQKEATEFQNSMQNLLDDFDTFKEFDPHNHVLEHSGSYRDVLYDMYIRR